MPRPYPRAAPADEHAAPRTPDRGGMLRAMSAEPQEPTKLHGGRLVARRLKAHGVSDGLHAVGRAPVLDLRRLPGGGDRAGRRAPRVRRRVRRRGLGQGHARTGRVRAHGRARRDQRHERARVRAAEPLADADARRPRAGDALGPGIAAGGRPCAVRAAAGQAGDDRLVDRRDPGADRRRLGRGAAPALRPGLRRLPARPRLHGGRGGRAARSRSRIRRRRPTGACSTAPWRCCAMPSGP